MAKSKRNIGLEILEGLREIKRGEHGRIINIPEVASIREKTGLSQARFAQATRCIGSHAAGLGAGASSPLWCRKNVACGCKQESPCIAGRCLSGGRNLTWVDRRSGLDVRRTTIQLDLE
jgi:hypothetical protein